MKYFSEKAKALVPYVAGIQPKESGWIKLNTNENPYPPSPKVEQAIRNADITKLRLYPDCDSVQLCEAIAKTFGLSAENIFIGNSSDEVLALAFQAFFSAKKNVLMPEISYGFYPVWSQMYDVGVISVPLRLDYTIDPETYKGASGVVIANPNAPTGIALTVSQIERIVMNNPDGVVIIDEAYMDFAEIDNAIGLVAKYDNLLVVRTFSKSYSLAGLRVGFAVGNKDLIDGLQRMKNAFNSYPLDRLAQIGAKAAVEDAAYFDETRKRVIATRKDITKQLRGLGFRVLDSEANFILMETEDAKKLYEYLLGNKILVRYWNKPNLSNFLRVTIGTNEEMEVFKKCVKSYVTQKKRK